MTDTMGYFRELLQVQESCVKGTNTFGFEEYTDSCSFFGGTPPLPEGAGWAVIVGAGLIFSLLTTGIVWIDFNFGGTEASSEEFNTAGRSIKTGLTAAVIVSQWTWAATLLQSSNVAWKYGVSGPFWYASGATIQVLLFGILALQVKLKAPRAHTILEIIRARWGRPAHLVFLVFCLMTNTLVSAMLVLGGASVVEALTGVDLYAASFIIPIGVIFYTAAGGLKATFMASYIHTAILYIALCIFMFGIYADDSSGLGSPGKVWENLKIISDVAPVVDNKGGSYLTMLSKSGFIFGIINVVGNFGTVFVDQSYWQSAIAAKPSATYKGYILGGMCWFAIPFSLATALGLASRALDLPITAVEAGNGLVPPAVAVHMMGKGGAVLVLVMLFMAVTSTGSAEQIAVSSLLSYDVYKEYINPKATGTQLMWFGRFCIVGYGIFMGLISIILFEIGLSLGWVYLFMGIMVGPAVFPIYCCLCWNKTPAIGAIAGAVCGQVAALTAWLVVCKTEHGEITKDLLGNDYPMLAGNVAALGVSAIVTTIVSLVMPEDFDWDIMRNNIEMVEQDGTDKLDDEGEDSYEGVQKALTFTTRYGTALALLLVVVWPCLALPAGVFSKGYFTFWTILAIVWGLVATVAMIIWPVAENLPAIAKTLGNLFAGKRVPVESHEPDTKTVVKTTETKTGGHVAQPIKPLSVEEHLPTDALPMHK